MWRIIYSTYRYFQDNDNRNTSELIDVDIIESYTNRNALQQLINQIPLSMLKKAAGEPIDEYTEIEVIAVYEIKKDVKLFSVENLLGFQEKVLQLQLEKEKEKEKTEKELTDLTEKKEKELYERLKKKYDV